MKKFKSRFVRQKTNEEDVKKAMKKGMVIGHVVTLVGLAAGHTIKTFLNKR